jgi:hypothetical protein
MGNDNDNHGAAAVMTFPVSTYVFLISLFALVVCQIC